MAGERADAVPEAVRALYEFAQEEWGWGGAEYESVRDAVEVVLAAAAAPLLPGGGEAERLLASDDAMLKLCEVAWESAGTAMPCTAEGGREGLQAALDVLRSARPDAERAPQVKPCPACGLVHDEENDR